MHPYTARAYGAVDNREPEYMYSKSHIIHRKPKRKTYEGGGVVRE